MVLISDECNNSLGMESGKILDSDIVSSSSYDYGTGPQRGRYVIKFNFLQYLKLINNNNWVGIKNIL